MIALWMLLGAALIVVAGALFDRPAVVGLAAFLAIASIAAVALEAWQAVRDRRIAYRRWREWQRVDAARWPDPDRPPARIHG